MNIAIIPARGGSKRIPRKNIKVFEGTPMIGYAIDAAFKSGVFEHVIVTTDDLEIGKIARDLGAKTPFIRPSQLADDFCATVPVIAHAIEKCLQLGWRIDYACCIYPAVPFLRASDLVASYTAILESNLDYCFPVARHHLPIQRALSLKGKHNQTEPLFDQYIKSRTQDLEPTYYDAGQFYWGKASAWLDRRDIFNYGSAFVIPNDRAIDIDTPDDWNRAQSLKEKLI